jgi:hypothetical protein
VLATIRSTGVIGRLLAPHKVDVDIIDIAPRSNPLWWRAHDKRVDCEGYAGGVACEVRAAPARKLFSFGMAD